MSSQQQCVKTGPGPIVCVNGVNRQSGRPLSMPNLSKFKCHFFGLRGFLDQLEVKGFCDQLVIFNH